MNRRYWTTRDVRELRRLYPDTENGEIGRCLGRSWSAVQNLAGKLDLRKSPAFMESAVCRWPKGNRPWNDGKKGWQPGGRAKRTQFKKGHRGARQKPVGTERRGKDGIEVKVAEPNVWISKARHVWTQHFGPIPSGALVRLRDGNRENCSAGNLLLITRQENARLNARARKPRKARPAYWLRPVNIEAAA